MVPFVTTVRTPPETAEQFRRWHQEEGPLTIPVLAIGGEYSTGTAPAEDMRKVATDVTGVVIPGSGPSWPKRFRSP
ncbi:hypothetical protein N8I84_02555 [Streptomyces cynarae]|uniref:Uncharacterized protein n=1 Tax=Streptomyces cynarae TaxID=2981134 RepID=A0ABY6DW44_9ACTN|nr:hypothetical protein [Streptomyces cynarae]UXY17741.1 hypothetical protein N8I84_02555 [Streptomyces cynarae]